MSIRHPAVKRRNPRPRGASSAKLSQGKHNDANRSYSARGTPVPDNERRTNGPGFTSPPVRPPHVYSCLSDALADRKSHQVGATFDAQLLHHSLLMPINGLWTTRKFPGDLYS